ncbi:MAG: PQQ-binding-like beta-propeller repeat protein [Planctomycetes bacterium]|nr:PQQ-binding-like beta-propeller repeat protein [Planctomycetota bacterium]
MLLAQRGWRDLAAGTLSSDGHLVFALESTGFLSQYYPPTFLPRQRRPTAATDYNRLVAYDLSTAGKLKWEVRGQREYALELAGAFFLGPPLPLDGHLYCLVEISGDVRLVVLDASTGKFEWSQTLGLPESALLQYPLRRLAGLTPAYSNGLLICPTTSGMVVAFDLSRRMLRWAYRYSRSIPELRSDQRNIRRMRPTWELTTARDTPAPTMVWRTALRDNGPKRLAGVGP